MERGVQVTVNAAEGAGVARLALPARNRAVQTWEAAVQGLVPVRQRWEGGKASRGLVKQVALLLGLSQAVLAVQVVHPHPLGAALRTAGAGERPGPLLGVARARPFLCATVTGQQRLLFFLGAEG